MSPPTLVRIEPTIRGAIIVAGALAAGWVVLHLVPVILVVVVALFVVGTLHPAVAWLERKHWKRGRAIAVVFGCAAVAAVLVLGLTIPSLVSQVAGLVDQEPAARARLVELLSRSPLTASLADSLREVKYGALVQSSAGTAWEYSSKAVELVAYFASAVFLALYIMIDATRLRGGLFALVPRGFHLRLSRILLNLETIVGGYIRGQALTSLFMAVFVFVLHSGSESMASKFDASQPLIIPGRSKPIHDYHKGGGILSMEDAFILSSNISTAKMAMHAGGPLLEEYFRRYGLLQPARVELKEAARPLVPRRWDPSTVASASFGQAIGVTPLHMAAGVGALMNGGVWHPLTLLKRAPNAPLESRRVIKPETSRLMLELMRDNVVMKEGSGKKADALGLRVGGKTGSAQKVSGHGYGKTNVSSFAAVFPADGPVEAQRYLVFVLFDEPHATPKTFGFMTAGWNAAPTAGRVIDRIAPFLGVKRVAATPFDPPKSPEAALPAAEDESTGPL